VSLSCGDYGLSGEIEGEAFLGWLVSVDGLIDWFDEIEVR
jgi:hypothetical protein